jgi:FkbM family methyltransferase
MADIWFALLGQRQQVPFVCLDHEQGWLRATHGFQADSIYGQAMRRARNGATVQTQIVRAHGRWQLHQPPRAIPRRTAPDSPAPDSLGPIVRVPVQGPSKRAELRLPQYDHITLAVQGSGTYYERDLLEAIRRCDVRGTYVDVGAHYGNHTLFFALECPATRVIAIEPNPTSFEGLRGNLHANGVTTGVTCLPIAIHPRWSHVRLAPLPWLPREGSPARTNSGMHGVVGADGPMPAARLEAALAPFGRIALIKVDAENLGPAILASGQTILARDHPVIAVEAATAERLTALHRLLDPLGYKSAGRYCRTPTWLWTPAEGAHEV